MWTSEDLYTKTQGNIFREIIKVTGLLPTSAAMTHYYSMAKKLPGNFDQVVEAIAVDNAGLDDDNDVDDSSSPYSQLGTWNFRERRTTTGGAARVAGASDFIFSKNDKPSKTFEKCMEKCSETLDCKSFSAHKPLGKSGKCALFSEFTPMKKADDRHQVGELHTYV